VAGRGYQLTAKPLSQDGVELASAPEGTIWQRTAPSAEAVLGNLPLQQAAIFGREQDIDRLHQALASERLITIVGDGGRGKSLLC
jgi:hypothetical protein